jgi:membrane-associated phospholipid phosphatase
MDQLPTIFLPLSIWFQGLGEWLIPPMQAITFLGNEFFYILVMPALYWCLNPALGIEIGIVLLLSGNLNTLLKLTFYSPRPFWISPEIRKLASGTSFGFPSGHAQNAASLWGLAAVKAQKLSLQIILVGVVFLIGLSRIVLGVHFFHDVLFGWLVGTLLLTAYLRLRAPCLRWFDKYSPGTKVLLVLICSLLFLGSGLVLSVLQSANPLPAEWLLRMETPADTASLESIFSISAIFFGMGSGIILLPISSQRLNSGSMFNKGIRYAVGLAGVLLLYAGLGALFPGGRTPAALILRYLRYTLIGAWIAWWAPLVFDRMGLLPELEPQG